ncbi:MAG: putative bifunctional diguanylate cyclase/phosphodiesterase [Synechococcaceae cyanobacterium]
MSKASFKSPAAPRLLLALNRLPRQRSLGIGLALIATIAGTLSLSQYLQDQMARHLIDKVLASQKLRIQEKVDRFDATLRDAETSVRRFASLLSDPQTSLSPDAASFEATFQKHPDGSWRVPRQRFRPQQDANGWIPPDVPLTAENKRFFLRALQVTRQFGTGALRDPLVNSWALPLINGMTAYWPTKPDYLYNADAKLDYRRTPWVTLTDPRVNPSHAPRWVGPEYDPAARDWSLSVVAPFFRNGQWAGSLGHDMVVSKLLANLFDRGDLDATSFTSPMFVATRDGHLLAKPDGVPRQNEKAPPAYAAMLRRPERGRQLAVIPEGNDYLVVASISTLKAKVLYRVDGGWLRRNVGKELAGLQVGQSLFVLLVVGSVIGLGLKDTQARQQEQRLLRERNRDLSALARQDQLTSLPNRLGLLEQAQDSLERARRDQRELLVVFVDLDHFKLVNDSLGHNSGDALLKAVAQRLRQGVRRCDTVARLGGDEFVLLIENQADPIDADRLVAQLHQTFETPVLVEDAPLLVTPSIGVSVFPRDGDDIETLMRQADLAMYEVKSHGRNGWLFFTEEMNRSIQDRLRLERDLRRAMETDEFQLVYQPQWELEGNRLIGWEALLRWQHHERGPVAPDVFIPIAEDTGLINQLGQMVLRSACHEAASWQKRGFGQFGISVNLSARQFAVADLEDQVDRALRDSGLGAEFLELEITESVLMDNPRRTNELLRHLKGRGVHVAIDDFGTGYSSLSYLSSFPIDRLKIDRSFVASSLSDRSGALIVEAIISLARSLGMAAIAEGVETQDQLEFLRRHGCHQIQGYLLGRPMPASEIEGFLRNRAC